MCTVITSVLPFDADLGAVRVHGGGGASMPCARMGKGGRGVEGAKGVDSGRHGPRERTEVHTAPAPRRRGGRNKRACARVRWRRG